MKRLRSKLTYANVMASIAVFLVLGGGAAFAATQMLPKNSVGAKQLKKGAVTPAKLSTTTKSQLTGAKGATGAQGPQGIPGAKGDKGERGPLPETLPSGMTERGFYDYAGTRASGGGKFVPVISASYHLPVAGPPSIEIIPTGGPPTANCPGSFEDPQALPGNTCVYQEIATGGTAVEATSAKFGFSLYTNVAEGGNWELEGSWAVTAP
jgi:hypothetical protein